jgi:tetratricopeptide (TPR) repeat protein
MHFYLSPYIGIGLTVFPRESGTVTTSLPILDAGEPETSLINDPSELLEFTVSKSVEQPYVKWKNLTDSPVEVISAQIVFKEKYIKPVTLKAAAKAAGEVTSLSILDRLTDDIFQLNRGKVVSASILVKYKGDGKTFNKTLPIEVSFKPEILKSFIQPKINEAQQNINWYGATDANQNKLGVVYARYGLYDEALNIFSNIVATSDYVPSLMNLGSIYMLKSDYFRVLPFLERAKDKDPYNTKVLIALAKAQMSVENFGSAKSIYYTLEALNPSLAKEYTWFKLTGDAARAAAESSNMKNIIVWAE